MPRRDDVRRLGQHRPRRVDPDHPHGARRGDQLRRHRRRLRAGRVGGDRRQGARRAAATSVVLATKFHGQMGDDPNQRGNSRRWIFQAVEDSLRRLQTDWIDLYQVHRPEPNTDIDETLGALTDLVRQGKIRYFGSSTFPAHRDRRGAVGRRAARPRAVRLRAAAVLAARPRDRGARCCPSASSTGWA